ncbi:MAG: cyclic nucleotide-binding domain-containing protein [Myxococcota bacterium]
MNEIPLDGLRDRVLALRAMPWTAPLDHEGLVLLGEHARHRSFRKGEVLIEPGRPVQSMFIVERGRVTVKVAGQLLARVTAGRVAGVTSMLAQDPRGASVIADEDSRALEIPVDAVFAAYEENFSVVRNGIRLMSSGTLQRRDRLPRPPNSDGPVPMGAPRDGTMTLVDRVRVVRQTPLFAHANLDAIFDVARNTVERRIAPGERLWSIGDPSSFWLYVEYGRMRCTNAEGRSIQVGANDVLGQLDCWAELPRSFEALAETELIVHQINIAAMLGVLETHHDLAMKLLAIIARSNLPTDAAPEARAAAAR